MAIEEVKETREEEPLLETAFIAGEIPLPVLPEEHPVAPRRPRISAVAVVGTFVLGIVAFLYFAKVFFLPILLALMLSFLLKPLVKWLARLKVPPGIGSAMVLLVMLVLLGHGMTKLSKPATDFISTLPESLRQVEIKIRGFIWHAEQLTKAAAKVEDLTKGNTEETPTPKVEVKKTTLADTALSATTSIVAGGLETLVLLYFLLAYGDLFLQKMVKVLPEFGDKKEAVIIAREVQQNISTFLLTITAINTCLGLLVGLGVGLVGLSNPVLWGVAAALLNFVPYFGPVLGVGILAVAGLLTFDSLGHAFIPPLIYLGLHALEANFITPMILGRRLTLNPVLIFVSLMFWTWLWGIPGALLSVPLLMMIKIFCDHFKPLAPVAEFLNGG